jgi:hypothetical protein
LHPCLIPHLTTLLLLLLLLQTDPNARPYVSELLEMPYVKQHLQVRLSWPPLLSLPPLQHYMPDAICCSWKPE